VGEKYKKVRLGDESGFIRASGNLFQAKGGMKKA